ncbi:hypothetical protein [Flavobacterium microcysteis]|uniref:Uncharacterized protein n=1 Tax=Flavobacterium microcysteis TaxID=2596891 RepID=A0A501Q6I2_9FLAO|nr:hypothetical protein [Flavobacterium microcysteis]TPD68500.1 hypothetical protein FJA49_10575 [Flavobacterium microcysteis]
MLKKPLSICSLVIILLALFWIFSDINKKNNYLNGTEVTANVIQRPYDCESINSRTSYIKIQYKNLVVSKKIGRGYCKKLEQTSIKAVLSPQQDYLFFEGEIESIEKNITASFLIMVAGIFCFIKSRKK